MPPPRVSAALVVIMFAPSRVSWPSLAMPAHCCARAPWTSMPSRVNAPWLTMALSPAASNFTLRISAVAPAATAKMPMPLAAPALGSSPALRMMASLSPPSMMTPLGSASRWDNRIVTGVAALWPQSKVTVPPPVVAAPSAAWSAASVQLAGVPLPTTALPAWAGRGPEGQRQQDENYGEVNEMPFHGVSPRK